MKTNTLDWTEIPAEGQGHDFTKCQ